MAKYRKKPIVIEAEQYLPGEGAVPAGVCDCRALVASASGMGVVLDAHVHTLEGPLRVSPGDWIITGIQGEKYPCKPEIFAATYEPA